MLLPKGLTLQMMQTKWASILNNLLKNPSLQSLLIKNIAVPANTNTVINHGLGRDLQGWRITRVRNVAPMIYDLQMSNPTPQLTLILNNSGQSSSIDIEVF